MQLDKIKVDWLQLDLGKNKWDGPEVFPLKGVKIADLSTSESTRTLREANPETVPLERQGSLAKVLRLCEGNRLIFDKYQFAIAARVPQAAANSASTQALP